MSSSRTKGTAEFLTEADSHKPAAWHRTHHLEAWLRGHDETAPVSSFTGSHDLPFQRWMKFKEAFSPKFVMDALLSMPRPPRRCADPFGGSGTTALTCSFLGVEAITIEVNPFLADLIESKLAPPSAFELSAQYAATLARSREDQADTSRLADSLPATFREPPAPRGQTEEGQSRFVFWREALDRILALRLAIEACPEERSQRLLKVLLGSILVQASNVVVNGKGRRYRSGWVGRRVTAQDVDGLFAAAAHRAARDLGSFGHRTRAKGTVLRGDSRLLAGNVGSVDAAVFSPPYPNSFDYTDVYNIELWTLGYLDSSVSNRTLRQSTLRSHVQVSFARPGIVATGLLAETMGRLEQARGRLWDSRIPEMVLGYFEDMDKVMRALHTQIQLGGRMFMVVGDSRYANVHVNVAAILLERAEAIGFAKVSNDPIRSMRSSAQHGGHHDLPETCLVMERA